jgi:hypothetical protein
MLRGDAMRADKKRGWSREHVMPRACAPGLQGNIVLAHKGCHERRGDRLPSLDDVRRALEIRARLERGLRGPNRNSLGDYFGRSPAPAPASPAASYRSAAAAKAGLGSARKRLPAAGGAIARFGTIGDFWPGPAS